MKSARNWTTIDVEGQVSPHPECPTCDCLPAPSYLHRFPRTMTLDDIIRWRAFTVHDPETCEDCTEMRSDSR